MILRYAAHRSALFSILLCLLPTVTVKAHTTRHSSAPLTTYEYLTNHTLEILPRHPFHDTLPTQLIGANRKGGLTQKDSFRLTINAYGQTFYLHLAPHDHLLHPETVVVVDDGEERHVQDDVRVFTGSVFDSEEASGVRFERGVAARNRLAYEAAAARGDGAADEGLVWAVPPEADLIDSEEGFDFEKDARRGSSWKNEFAEDEEELEDARDFEKVGTARIVMHRHSHDLFDRESTTTFEGLFTHEEDSEVVTYTIKTLESYLRSKREHDVVMPARTAQSDDGLSSSDSQSGEGSSPSMIIYREVDKRERTSSNRAFGGDGDPATVNTCGSEGLDWNVGGQADLFLMQRETDVRNLAALMGSRNASVSKKHLTKRFAAGCPTTQKVLRMAAAADCSYVASYGSTDAALQQIITDWALASKVFERTFNVALSLIRVEIRSNCENQAGVAAGLRGPGSATITSNPEPWNKLCTNPSYTINNRLSDFSKWRGLRSPDSAGLWHLLTRCSTDSTVGISWLNMLCQTDAFSQGGTALTTDPSASLVSGGPKKPVISMGGVRKPKGGKGIAPDQPASLLSRDGLDFVLTNSDSSNSGGEFVSGTGVSSITRDEWRVVAHEIAHNFGAVHDCGAAKCSSCPTGALTSTSCGCCPCGNTVQSCDCGGVFLMNPTSDSGPGEFSPCSAVDICTKLGSGATSSCLVDATAPANASIPKVVTANQCGNGLKEAGEQCDCGPDDDCRSGRNPCCDANCKLKSGAVCSDTNDACCNSCKPVAAQTVCRPSISSCDLPETCNGVSGECPADAHLPDGQACQTDTSSNYTLASKLTCALGQCTSRELQCKMRMMSNSVQECAGFRDTCSLVCAPAAGAATCVELQGGFLDGTPCGYGGSCSKSFCVGSNPVSAAIGFLKNNLPISLGVAAVLLLCFAFCLRQCARVRRKKKAAADAKYKSEQSATGPSFDTRATPPPHLQQPPSARPRTGSSSRSRTSVSKVSPFPPSSASPTSPPNNNARSPFDFNALPVPSVQDDRLLGIDSAFVHSPVASLSSARLPDLPASRRPSALAEENERSEDEEGEARGHGEGGWSAPFARHDPR